MKLKEFVSIHQNTGYKINFKEGQYFLNRGLINYSFPQLNEALVNKNLINFFKWRYLITVLKTEYRIKNTYEYVLKTSDYDIEGFRKKTRTTIRKSIRECIFKRPTLNELIVDGLEINKQTLAIQKRKDKYLSNAILWKKYITSLYNNDFTIVGAYVDNKLIGYAIAYEFEEKQFFHLQHINRDYGTYYPMSGLMYVVVNHLIDKLGRVEISDGIESFTPMPSLNSFKNYMRFDRIPITRVYIINPIFLAVIKLIIGFYIHILGKKNIRNPIVRKMINLYQGNRILVKMISALQKDQNQIKNSGIVNEIEAKQEQLKLQNSYSTSIDFKNDK